MDRDALLPATADTTPTTSPSRFTARTLEDLLELLRTFQKQSGPAQPASPGAGETTGAQD